MKSFITFLSIIAFTFSIMAQVQNPSFEIDDEPTTEGWSNSCDLGLLVQDAPANGGNWSLGLMPGNTQGCFPSYYYQTFPSVTDGDLFLLSAWLKSVEGEIGGLYFAKLTAQNEIILLDGDTTSAQTWTALSIEQTIELEQGDTAAIVLTVGLVGGPAGGTISCLFDEIYFEQSTVTNELFTNPLNIFPNPTTGTIYLKMENERYQDAELVIVNLVGQIVFKEEITKNEEVNVSVLNEGIYFYCIESENQRSSSRKLIITK